MRYISKLNRCEDFDRYIATVSPRNWSRFNPNKKIILHQHLLKEQQFLCVYCQQSIPPKLTKDIQPGLLHPSHIEHIRPKDTHTHLTYEYTNLGVSCNGFDVTTPPAHPDFCGHPKDNEFDEHLFLHPFEIPDIEDYFQYDINGKILPSSISPLKSQKTITLLRLDNPILENMRAEQYLILIEEVTATGLDITLYLDETLPELPKFHSMLKQLFAV